MIYLILVYWIKLFEINLI